MMRRLLCVLFLAVASLAPRPVFAQSADNVLLIINDASQASVQIGEYYMRKRAIAQDHVVHVKAPTTDTISRNDYFLTIERPIGNWLSKYLLMDRVLFIVLTKGVPLRVDGTQGLEGSMASVDSELTLVYRKLVGAPGVPIAGRVANPYYLGQKPLSAATPFTRFASDIYLVTRLDGYTVEDVTKLIDRGSAPSTTGKIVLDQRATLLDAGGDKWLQETATRLRESGEGDRVVLEMTRSVVSTDGPVLGYDSWGSNDPSNRLRHFGLQFAPGAIAAMFVSTDGRTFTEPPADWVPGGTDQRGYGSQTLAGDLIRDGVTGVAAHVAEPLLDATIRPQILFPAYLNGFNLAESYYLAMPFLSWQTVVVGDPLCRPFAHESLTDSQLLKSLDPETALPGLFSERRLAAISVPGANPQAMKLALKGENLLNQGQNEAATPILEQAFALEPRLSALAFTLGTTRSAAGDHAGAVEIYRKAIAVSPDSPILLNNLAYELAEFQHDPSDALPFAEKAYAATRDANVGDTLGWIHHLMGNDQLAAPLINQAVAAIKDNPDVLMHAAFVHAALGDLPRAKTELDAALKLDPKIADRSDVKALQERLKKGQRD